MHIRIYINIYIEQHLRFSGPRLKVLCNIVYSLTRKPRVRFFCHISDGDYILRSTFLIKGYNPRFLTMNRKLKTNHCIDPS